MNAKQSNPKGSATAAPKSRKGKESAAVAPAGSELLPTPDQTDSLLDSIGKDDKTAAVNVPLTPVLQTQESLEERIEEGKTGKYQPGYIGPIPFADVLWLPLELFPGYNIGRFQGDWGNPANEYAYLLAKGWNPAESMLQCFPIDAQWEGERPLPFPIEELPVQVNRIVTYWENQIPKLYGEDPKAPKIQEYAVAIPKNGDKEIVKYAPPTPHEAIEAWKLCRRNPDGSVRLPKLLVMAGHRRCEAGVIAQHGP